MRQHPGLPEGDRHGVTNVVGGALGALEETQKKKAWSSARGTVWRPFTPPIAGKQRLQVPNGAYNHKPMSTSSIPWILRLLASRTISCSINAGQGVQRGRDCALGMTSNGGWLSASRCLHFSIP